MGKTEYLIGGLRLLQDERQFKLCTDSVLLAHFPSLKGVKRVCDLGSGAGTLPLLLCARGEGFTVDGVETQEAAAELSRRSIALNGLDARIRIVDGDVGNIRELLPAGQYSLVVSNPPYFDEGSGRSKLSPALATAREGGLPDFCRAAAWLLQTGGRFCLVFRVERLAELCALLRENSLEPKRLRFIQHNATSLPELFLLEARRGGKTGLKLEPPLILKNADGSESEEIRRIYGR